MQHRKSADNWIGSRTAAVLCIVLLFLMSVASVSQAQSGRRPPKQPSSPDPLPPKQDEPPIKPSAKEDNSTPGIPIKVGWYLQNMNTSSIYPRIVEDGCLERLSQTNSVKASPTKELNRKEAIDIAKGSTDTYVLWFELDAEYTGQSGLGGVNPQSLSVRFEVFTPGTGKIKTSGHVYQRQRGPGNVPIPLPRSAGSAEYMLRNCGREMADRLLDALSVARPPDRN